MHAQVWEGLRVSLSISLDEREGQGREAGSEYEDNESLAVIAGLVLYVMERVTCEDVQRH